MFDLCDGRPGLCKYVDKINITETFNDIDKMMNEKEMDYEKLFKISEKYKKIVCAPLLLFSELIFWLIFM